ncbi:MAG: hypothetical protein K6F05_06020 [Succinivibrio sp.]|nr:hypothetical protein [Succinivibrio sp.]
MDTSGVSSSQAMATWDMAVSKRQSQQQGQMALALLQGAAQSAAQIETAGAQIAAQAGSLSGMHIDTYA